jgi:hypothetical protein
MGNDISTHFLKTLRFEYIYVYTTKAILKPFYLQVWGLGGSLENPNGFDIKQKKFISLKFYKLCKLSFLIIPTLWT